MSTITQITEHPRKAGRYVVDVDGREFATVTADALTATQARVGVVVDDSLAAHLREANEHRSVRPRAQPACVSRAIGARPSASPGAEGSDARARGESHRQAS